MGKPINKSAFTDKHVKMQMLLNQKPRLRLLSLFNQVAVRVVSRREGAVGDVKRTRRKHGYWQTSIFQRGVNPP